MTLSSFVCLLIRGSWSDDVYGRHSQFLYTEVRGPFRSQHDCGLSKARASEINDAGAARGRERLPRPCPLRGMCLISTIYIALSSLSSLWPIHHLSHQYWPALSIAVPPSTPSAPVSGVQLPNSDPPSTFPGIHALPYHLGLHCRPV